MANRKSARHSGAGKDITVPGITKGVEEKIRLNRFIAHSGVCSRREADELIIKGFITVNGKTVTDLGIKVSVNDDIRYKNKRLSSEKKVYILLNKPRGYVTTVEDPHADQTVLDLIHDACSERVYPVGRLDKATTGVLLLTNDGDLTGKLTHPKYKRKKIYHVFLDKPVAKNDLFTIAEGVEIDDETIVADAVSYADAEDKTQIGIEIHSGQNRIVRRIFEKLGYKVKKLDRVYFAGLTKKNLPRGKWRFLNEKEINMLKRGIF
jgi:23S rRNA pseudouridine2605 synthase